jgi:murein DD-endopeptidase MepM/ murein hydrolase activator NlpD
MFLTFNGEVYVANHTGEDIWLLNAAESGPGPGPGPGPGDQTFDWPFDPNRDVSSEYGPRSGRIHQGIDFGIGSATRGAPIHASAGGVCSESGTNSGWGYTLVINHGVIQDRQLYTRYGHMENLPLFSVGQEIEKWAVLGTVGETGTTDGANLHWETHVCNPGSGMSNSNPGTHINPRTFMATYGEVVVP